MEEFLQDSEKIRESTVDGKNLIAVWPEQIFQIVPKGGGFTEVFSKAAVIPPEVGQNNDFSGNHRDIAKNFMPLNSPITGRAGIQTLADFEIPGSLGHRIGFLEYGPVDVHGLGSAGAISDGVHPETAGMGRIGVGILNGLVGYELIGNQMLSSGQGGHGNAEFL